MDRDLRRLEDIDVSNYNVRREQYAVIFPLTVMPRESVYSVYLEAQKRAMQAGIAFLGWVPTGKLIVRQLRPQDLGLPGPDWRFKVRAGRVELLSYRLRRDQALVIFGFYNQSQSPKVFQLEVMKGDERRLIVVLQDLYTKGYDPIGILAEFEVFRPGEEIRVVGLSLGDGDEELGIMGYVVEPEGRIRRTNVP
ncbi:MAG: hypothetical protein RXN88_04205 [Acidilobus sp.]|jgi:hypothetical protein|uniref:hypothetical protein n=1 Tax=Acidilobus sp. 7A TaxID=1577685 RepID=UPI000764D525|nr:hypothetical protein [Acidilobus sp. 7A]AMD30840.1 hypothetical protein SE86_05580 [Acidilobus sp. 7A]